MDTEKQHQLGQHYSKEKELLSKYDDDLILAAKNSVIVDPFCGECDMLLHFLNLFPFNEQVDLLKNKKVMGLDIDPGNVKHIKSKFKEIYNLQDSLLDEIFLVNDSLLNNSLLPKNSFIFTNPPYLAKNVCKKKFKDDYVKYYENVYSEYNDYFEISLDLYSKFDGVWIVPSNLFSSDIMDSLRGRIINKLSKVVIFKKKMFEDTDISVCTFLLNNGVNHKKVDVDFISKSNTKKMQFDITLKGNLSSEWEKIKETPNFIKVKQGYLNTKINSGTNKLWLLDEEYKEKEYDVSDEDKKMLENNILILRTTDTGGKDGKVGLYTIEEIWGSKKAIGLVTKISSRVYTQLFFENLSIDEQKSLKDKFNKELNALRNKYESIFLTNYKNVSNEEQRKRITFKEVFSLINHIVKKV